MSANVRTPKVAITVDLSKAKNEADAKKLLAEAVAQIPDAHLKGLKSGIVTVIA